MIAPVETIASTILLRTMSTTTFFRPAENKEPARHKITEQFLSESINVPVLGIVENMAYFTPEELPDNKMSRIKFELQDVNLFNETDWEKMNDFFVLFLPKFESAIEPFIKNLK